MQVKPSAHCNRYVTAVRELKQVFLNEKMLGVYQRFSNTFQWDPDLEISFNTGSASKVDNLKLVKLTNMLCNTATYICDQTAQSEK